MSLIGEALKRARLEAARREGEERGTAHSSMPAYLPARRRSRAGVAGAIVLAAAAGATVVYLLVGRSSTPTTSAHPPFLGEENEGVGGDSGVAPSSPAAAASSPTPAVAAPATFPDESAAPAPPSPASDARPSPARSSAIGTGTASPATPTPARPAPPSAVAGHVPAPVADPLPPGARVYVRVAQVGSTRLELDGIVASPTDPVAMINRKLLGIGEGIEGWVVEKIEPKQVTLRGGRELVVIRLR